MHGTSLRVGYSKFIAATDTNISVAAYRFSTAGYLNLTDAAIGARSWRMHGGDINSVYRQRNRMQVSVNQKLEGSRHDVRDGLVAELLESRRQRHVVPGGLHQRFKYGTYSLTAGRTRIAGRHVVERLHAQHDHSARSQGSTRRC